MVNDIYEGCRIRRIGDPNSYKYLVDADWDGVEDPNWVNRPLNYVNWGDAARFANWLHNGQPTGAQDPNTTEDGAYYLNGATDPNDLLAVARKAGAKWVIPTEDEWYKAAFYDPAKPGGAGYWDYPTRSDDPNAPSNDLVEPNDTGNNATFHNVADNDDTIGSPYWRTEVGAHENSDSPYGTFDQGGNVNEWSETLVYDTLNDNTLRGLRGGSFSPALGPGVYGLHASSRGANPLTLPLSILGFRVASIPEPSTAVLGMFGLLCVFWWRRGAC